VLGLLTTVDAAVIQDNFEDGVINTGLWVSAGRHGGVGNVLNIGPWQSSFNEVAATDGYLEARVWGPPTANTYFAVADVRTTHNFNDGNTWVINFRWETTVKYVPHCDVFVIQVTDGNLWPSAIYGPLYDVIPGTQRLWSSSLHLGAADTYYPLPHAPFPKTAWSIKIEPTGLASFYQSPNAMGAPVSQVNLDANYPWYLRFKNVDCSSAGFDAGDNTFRLYDFYAVTTASGAPANQPPVANAGLDQNIIFTSTAHLNGSASYDPDGDPIVSYMWTIDSAPAGSTAVLVGGNTATPSLTPDMPGQYIMSLVVSDGKANSAATTVSVTATQNMPPVALATGMPVTGFAPLAVNFDASGSSDPEGGALSYFWDFGDPSSGFNNTSALVNPNHTYANVGAYTAILTVTDNMGLTNQASVMITVSAPNQPPTVGPTASLYNGLAPLDVQFTANGIDPEGAPLTYLWNFGDGTTSTVANPLHTYVSPGAYVANVNASDGQFTATGSVTISVGSPLACNVKDTKTDEGEKGKVEGKVDFKANFTYTGIPNPSDMIEVTFDNIPLISEPFAAFAEEYDEPGVFEFKDKDLHMTIDFNKSTIKFSRHKMVLDNIDNSNGIDIVIYFGNAACTDHIVMQERENDKHEKSMSHKEKD